MTEALEFTSGTRRAEPLSFTLDGQTYTFVPPKKAVMMLPAYTGEGNYFRAQFDWLEQGLNLHDWAQLDRDAKLEALGVEVPEKQDGENPWQAPPIPPVPPEGWQGAQSAALEKRLRDPADTFDTPVLDQVITRLAEVVGGRPTS